MSDPVTNKEQEESVKMLSKDYQKAMVEPDSKEGGIISSQSKNIDSDYHAFERSQETELNRFQKIMGGVPRRNF